MVLDSEPWEKPEFLCKKPNFRVEFDILNVTFKKLCDLVKLDCGIKLVELYNMNRILKFIKSLKIIQKSLVSALSHICHTNDTS